MVEGTIRMIIIVALSGALFSLFVRKKPADALPAAIAGVLVALLAIPFISYLAWALFHVRWGGEWMLFLTLGIVLAALMKIFSTKK